MDDGHHTGGPASIPSSRRIFAPVPALNNIPDVLDNYLPAPDLFGPAFQPTAFPPSLNDDDHNAANDENDGRKDPGYQYPDPDAMPSIEFPDYPSPFSGNGTEAASPASDEQGDSAERDYEEDPANGEADGLDPSPGQVQDEQSVPRRRPGRPRKRVRTGQRGGWNRGTRSGPKRPLEPSPEFTALYQQAMRAYNFDGDLDTAHEIIVEAISMNPEVFNAHILLADIWFARGETSNAVQALWAGAHCYPRDPFVWYMVVEACLERATYARQIALNQARYALKALLKINTRDCEALFQLASVEREAGRPKKALDLLDKILVEMPHNTDALKLYSETCITMQKLDVAIDRYKEAIFYYRTNGLQLDDTFEWADVSQYVRLLSLREGNREVILQSSIHILKKLCRWLLGRSSESYWDSREDDDAEFDLDDAPRRIAVPQFEAGRFSTDQYGLGLPMQLRVQLGILRLKQGDAREEALNHFAWLEPDDRSENASVQQFQDEFLDVANALNEAMEHREASRYFEALLRVDSDKEIAFWIGIGISAYICDQKDRALGHFQSALALDEDSIVAKTYMCKILAEQGNKLLAIKYGCEAVEGAYAAIPPSLQGVRKYERIEGRADREAAEAALRSALKLPGPAPPKQRQGRLLDDGTLLDGLELIKPRGIQPARPGKKAPKRPPRPPTPAEDKPQKIDDLRPIYNTLLNNYDAMHAGDSIATRIWMSCAKTMINDFRANDIFYPREKHMQFQGYDQDSIQASRRPLREKRTSVSNTHPSLDADSPLPSVEPQANIFTPPTTYRDIPFDVWLDIFLEFALLTSLLPPSTTPTAARDAYLVLSAATSCVIWYHSPPDLFLINCVHLVCAINLRDQITLFGTVLPWFMTHFPFRTDAYRLFQAMHCLFPFPNDPAGKLGQMENAYMSKSTKTSRHLFRHLNAIDHWLVDDYADPETGEPVPEFMRKSRDETLAYYAPTTTTGTATSSRDSSVSNAAADHKTSPIRTTEMDAVLLVLYGQLLFAKGQYLSALPWFHRARALVPQEPLVALLLALCYFHQPLKPGFNKGMGEKHGWMMQGVAMLEEYGTLRIRQAEGNPPSMMSKREAEREVRFNKARCWAMLGLGEMGLQGFEAVSSSSSSGTVGVGVGDKDENEERNDAMEVDGEGEEDKQTQQQQQQQKNKTTRNIQELDEMDMLSAYAMRTTYALSGNTEMARKITEQYLVV